MLTNGFLTGSKKDILQKRAWRALLKEEGSVR